jgi:dTDP-4-dehydrorhamnose 3,5-epimerase-like enzyme
MVHQQIQGVRIMNVFQFQVMKDDRGSLVAIESLRHVPFEIKRVYYIYNVRDGIIRGKHAHRKLQQVLICVAGSCKILVDNGSERRMFVLDSPSKGLYVGQMVWREMSEFTSDCVLLVLASEHYDESDYIRSYEKFLSEVHAND